MAEKADQSISNKEKIEEILSFQIGKQEFAFDVDSVELVIERAEITPVPKSRSYIEGVMNLRGRIVPVVDLTKLIHIETDGKSNFENVLIVKHEGSEVGFFVNEVREVINVKESEIDTGARTDQLDQKVRGVVKKGKRLILFMDIDEIMKACEGA
jgi:purine-binding chemotaxis protein CheW